MMKKLALLIGLFAIIHSSQLIAQSSIARQWNDEVLEAIRLDFARPTVHARNLFHISAAMYDAWASYEPTADTYFLGKTVQGFTIPYNEIIITTDTLSAQEEAISYAAYRLIRHRFRNAPSYATIQSRIDLLMSELGYDSYNTCTNYNCCPAGKGNYIAGQIIQYGMQDGANEQDQYANLHYEPVNPPLSTADNTLDGNPNLIDFNRWQPLQFPIFVDQSGNETGGGLPEFLGAEWGVVSPFSLKSTDAVNYERDGNTYTVYHDPGPPVYLNETNTTGLEDYYKWGHTLVAAWSSHLNRYDPLMWDISPASKGNISSYPTEISDYPSFYNLLEGGDTSIGHDQNPVTSSPYAPNLVSRSDYTRVLAEFWADGPDSETPPGHWFTILNTVNDHPQLEKKMMGTGEVLSDLEWDVKSYFILGGAMHDAAIAAWGIKGWYDYIRPISAIKGMADFGQGSDPSLPSYHELGLPLIPGLIEIIEEDDFLASSAPEMVGEIKVYAWKRTSNPTSTNVGWILAKRWKPYQNSNFVTPPFAGFVSGHSTFSRAAAEVLTALTGTAFFPGGIGEFVYPMNSLVFDSGPSEEITLQWATYRDASDQCSLSRIWGGIHPPVDDIPGRLIGEKIGVDAFNYALPYFTTVPEIPTRVQAEVFPNPTDCGFTIQSDQEGNIPIQVFQLNGKLVMESSLNFENNQAYLDLARFNDGTYIVLIRDSNGDITSSTQIIKE